MKHLLILFLTVYTGNNCFAINFSLSKTEIFTDTTLTYNKSTGLYYTLNQDDKNFYILLKSNNISDQNKILLGGISVSFNTSGKKRQMQAITFPIADRKEIIAEMKSGSQSLSKLDKLKKQEKLIALFKEIRVSGIQKIVLETIPVNNKHGINATLVYDEKNALIYKLKIPFELLDIQEGIALELAVNVRVNGLAGANMVNRESLGVGNRPNQQPPPGASVNASPLFNPEDFWIKKDIIYGTSK